MTSVSMVRLRKAFGALSVLLLLGGWLGGDHDAFAQQPPRHGQGFAAQPSRSQENPGGRAHLDLTVVYANHSGQVDPRVARLKNQFGSMGFTGFQVLSTQDAQLAAGQDTTMNVQGGQKLEVSLVSRTDSTVKVRIQLQRNGNKVVDTTTSSPPNKAFTVVVGNYQDGKLLVVIKAD